MKFALIIFWLASLFFCLWVWISFFSHVAAASQITGQLTGYVNEYRVQQNLPRVAEHPLPCLIAQLRVEQIKNDYSHAGFYELAPILRNYGIWYENLAMTGTKIKGNTGILAAWEASAGHKQNLLADIDYGCSARSGRFTAFIGWRLL